jgi:hypothetical protein
MRDPGVKLDTTLPPWRSHDARDQERLRKWTIEQLVNEDAARELQYYEDDAKRDYSSMASSLTPAEERQWFRFEWAKAAARNGDVTLLRKLYPEIAPFIHPVRRKRGEHRPRIDYEPKTRLRLAIDDVHRIRALWAQHYGGRGDRMTRSRPRR